MNRRVYTLLVLLVAGLAVTLSAQTIRLQANIPFAFTVGNKTLPAGEYMVRTGTNPYVLLLQGEASGPAALSMTIQENVIRSKDPAGVTKLEFNKYGDRYFLAHVTDGYAGTELTVPVSRSERELAKTASAERFEVLATLAQR